MLLRNIFYNKNNEIYSLMKVILLCTITICIYFIFSSFIVSSGIKDTNIMHCLNITLSFIVSIIIFIKCIEKKKLSDICISFRKIDILFLVIGILLSFLFVFFLILILQSFNTYTFKIQNVNIDMIIHYLLVAVLGEFIFRGFLLNDILKHVPFTIKSIIISFAFILINFTTHINIINNILILFTYSIFANYITKFTKSIWLTLGFSVCFVIIFNLFLPVDLINLAIDYLPIIFIFLCLPIFLIAKNENN